MSGWPLHGQIGLLILMLPAALVLVFGIPICAWQIIKTVREEWEPFKEWNK